MHEKFLPFQNDNVDLVIADIWNWVVDALHLTDMRVLINCRLYEYKQIMDYVNVSERLLNFMLQMANVFSLSWNSRIEII